MESTAKQLRKEVEGCEYPKRMKIKTLLSHFGYKKRSDDNTTLITESLANEMVQMHPSIMRLGSHWELTLDDWVYLSKKEKKELSANSIENTIPDNWNTDGWFDSLQDKEFRTEKEVETKFILPLLEKLGFVEDDRFDAMPVNAAHGSRSTILEIDFAMFDSGSEELENQVLLVVEAKKEHRLIKQAELEKAQRQTKSYSVWLGCHFGLITDSRTIQVLDLMPNIGGMEVLFECSREELKSKFEELHQLTSKTTLSKYYRALMR
jgi:hypothetical protein